METTEQLIDQLFNNLDEWRNLPAYQLERRADIFFSLYLDQVVKLAFGEGAIIDFIIPEFPVKKADSFKSCKIDYVAINRTQKMIYFIELKTDMGSINEVQWDYLQKAQEKKIGNLIKDIFDIAEKSSFGKKYNSLLGLISQIGDDLSNQNHQVKLNDEYKIEILYIVPCLDKSTEAKKELAKFITFEKLADSLDKENNHIATRFAESLRKWIHSPNAI